MEKPQRPERGDKIGIVAPASPLYDATVNPAVQFFSAYDFAPQLGAHLHDKSRFLAGDDKLRVSDINGFAQDPDIKAIVAARGGYGTPRLLNMLDYGAFAANKPAFVGFSDTTALQMALLAKAGLISYSGCTLVPDIKDGTLHKETRRTLFAALGHENYSVTGGTCLNPGCVTGTLLPGTLSLLSVIAGSPYMPATKGAILVLEDVGEEPYHIDRMLTGLALKDVFNDVAAVVFGQFAGCTSKDERDGTIQDVLQEWADKLDKPVVTGFPYGHIAGKAVLPVGGMATLNAQNGTVDIDGS